MNEEIVKPKTRNITDLFDSDSEESVHNEDINTGNTVEVKLTIFSNYCFNLIIF